MLESKQDKQEVKPPVKLLLKEGRIYYDNISNEEVEFRYLGATGMAIVCQPGDSGGGMQSCWGVAPDRLTPTARLYCSECGQERKK